MKVICIFINIVFLNITIQWGSRQNKQPEEKKDLYGILELNKRASQEDIKSQYRKLTRKYHPDKKDGNLEKFRDISEAYEILSDSNKRRIYDTRGYEAAKNSNSPNGQNEDEDDVFSSFFGGRMRKENKMDDQRIKIRVGLSDLYSGKEFFFKFSKNIICPHCRGSGAESDDDVQVCQKCGGNGIIIERQQLGPGFVQQFQRTCPKCGGKGKTVTKSCNVCKSEKIIPTIEEMNIYVEKGMSNGQEITYEDAADESPDKRAGNLVFIINEIKHNLFKRDGNNLSTEMTVSLKEALLGFTKELTHLDGRKVKIQREEVTQSGFIIKLKGEGMPVHQRSGEFGDLLVKINVEFPKELSEDKILIAESLFARRSNW